MKSLLKFSFALSLSVIVYSGLSQFSMGGHFNYHQGLENYGADAVGAFGTSFMGLYHVPNTSISIGGELGAACFAMSSNFSDLSYLGYPDASAKINEEYGIFTYAAIVRFEILEETNIIPYLEARAGGVTHYYSMELSEIDQPNDDEISHEDLCKVDVLGTAFQSGIGGGLTVDLNKIRDGGCPIFIDLGATYISGTQGVFKAPSDEFDPALSRTAHNLQSISENLNFRLGAFLKIK